MQGPPAVPAQCVGCEGLTETLSKQDIAGYAAVIPDWTVNAGSTRLSKLFRAKNFQVRPHPSLLPPPMPAGRVAAHTSRHGLLAFLA
jgi:hypothetical protein